MKKLYLVALLCSAFVFNANAQNVGVNADGSNPNGNAILDIKSPTTGQGKGLLIPRLTLAQRTVNNQAGGLLNGSGQLHAGAAQGLMVYQTDGTEGFYYNISTSATPNWVYINSVGPIGPTGNTGAAGAVGATGPQGNVGPTGSAGAVGATGPQGVQGNVGATGPQGVQGNVGATGSAGAVGATGPQGVQGNVGATGPQGVQGNVGATGPQGVQGNVGATGPQGVQGNVGTTGPQGLQGNVGATGPQGVQGNAGAVGATGPQGVQGNAGAVGATGPQGAQGVQGAQGPTGLLSAGITGSTPYYNGSAWVTNSTNIYNNGGNVGIGNSNPQNILHIQGAEGAGSGFTGIMFGGGTSGNAKIEVRGGSTPYVDFANDASIDFDARFILNGDDQLGLSGANLKIDNLAGVGTRYVTVDNTGVLGSTTLPTSVSTVTATAPVISSGGTSPNISLNFGNGPSAAAGPGTWAQGNFGQYTPHATYQDFNTTPSYWGWNYMQNSTNGPNAISSQWYRQIVSLGSDYAGRGAGGYSLELAYPRNSAQQAGVWMRTVENGGYSGWSRIDGGLPYKGMASSMHASMDDITTWTNLNTACADDAVYTVPWGFNFKINGVNYTQGWISTNGVLGFGTGSTTSFSNTQLPAAISNDPMLFFHWDDDGSNLARYTVLGAAPNRVCFIHQRSSEALSCTGGSSQVDIYIQLHENSNIISVRYIGIGSNLDVQGANATYGFQFAGGSAAMAIPLGYNARMLDDNAGNQSFSIDLGQ